MRVRSARAARHGLVAENLPRLTVEPNEIADTRLGRELLLQQVPPSVRELELERVSRRPRTRRGLAQQLRVLEETVDRRAPAGPFLVRAQLGQMIAPLGGQPLQRF